MRINLFSSSGIFQNSVILDGFTMNDYLTLARNPDGTYEAATKRYVDSFPSLYDVSAIEGETIPKELLVSSFGGVLHGFNRTDVLLSPTGVAPGSYNTVTVDASGLVTSARNETFSGYTLHFANIIGRPTSVKDLVPNFADYAVKEDGRVTVTGNLGLSQAPTQNNHLATYGYVTNKATNLSAKAPVGSLKYLPEGGSYSGYLRANGGLLSKSEYATLYAVLGDRYTTVTDVGNASLMGKPWKNQYSFNEQQSGVLREWTTETATLHTGVSHSQAIVTKNRVYLLGGFNGSSYISTVYTAPINEDGTLGAWTTATSLPAAVSHSQAIVTKNRVYLLGGYNSSFLSTVYTAPINEDGTLGAWTTGTSLPAAVSFSQAIVTKNRVYLLGGYKGSSFLSTVYTAPINEDGTLGAWTTGTSLPAAVSFSQAIVTKNRVYLLGGYKGSSSLSTVYTAPINEDGTLGAWTTGTSLPAAVSFSQAIVTKNRVYLLGGYNNVSGHLSTVYTAPINEDGTLGAWTTGTSLPAAVYVSQAIVTSSKLYLLGNQALSLRNQIYSAPFSGGVNDYQSLIATNGDSAFPADKFRLPDFSSNDDGIYSYYIKAI